MRARDALAASRALPATHAVSGRAVLEVVAETTIVVDAGPELVQVRLCRRGLRPARDARLHALRPDDVEPARDVAGRLAQHRHADAAHDARLRTTDAGTGALPAVHAVVLERHDLRQRVLF